MTVTWQGYLWVIATPVLALASVFVYGLWLKRHPSGEAGARVVTREAKW